MSAPRCEAAVTGEPVPAGAEQQARAEHELDAVLAAALVRALDGAARVAVRRKVVRGAAGPVLVAEADGATLLGVGSHRHRWFIELAWKRCRGLAGAVTQVWVDVLGSDATSAIWQMF